MTYFYLDESPFRTKTMVCIVLSNNRGHSNFLERPVRKDLCWILAIVFLGLLSFVDALLTWEAVALGVAKELNPFMDIMIQMGPWHFFISKLTLTIVGLAILYAMRRHVWAQFSIVFCLLIYLAITGIHLQFAW